MSQAKTYWISPPPEKCDLCGMQIHDAFVDGKTDLGPWGCMCLVCHAFRGRGIGTGQGQKYEKQPDGRWLKTEG